jgi:hypothetical protein
MEQPVSPEAVIALTLLNRDKPLEIKDISAKFLEIREKNLPVGKVALRRIPGGVYSEDVRPLSDVSWRRTTLKHAAQ